MHYSTLDGGWPQLFTTVSWAIRGVIVEKAEAKLKLRTIGRSRRREHGFTMIELTVVVAIIVIVLAMALFQLTPALQTAKSDTAMREMLEQVRQAREYAITNRRYVQITFPTVVINGITQYEVVITQRNSLTTGAGVDQVLSTTPISTPMAFTVVNAADTPDGFGNANAIEFNGLSPGPVGGMLFDATGALVSGATFLPINGSVFMGVATVKQTGRAVTVMGTSGRIRGWKNNGTTWTQF